MEKLLARIAYTLLLCWPLLGASTLIEPELFDLGLTPKHCDATYWAIPEGSNGNEVLINATAQLQQTRRFKTKWFAPWNPSAIERAIEGDRHSKTLTHLNKRFRNDIAYANTCANTPGCKLPLMQSNFRPPSNAWFAAVEQNTQLEQFAGVEYQENNRAIIIHNSLVRVFPVHDAYYEREKNVGLFHPFDRMQMSNIWAGTPVYILGTSEDKAWHYIYTHSYAGWVQAQNITRVDNNFIKQWQNNNLELIAIMKNNVSLNNQANDRFMTQIGIGAVLPGTINNNTITVSVPVSDRHGEARIAKAKISNASDTLAAALPIPATRENFARLLNDMVNKPYGWGGTSFNHDCSQELKNLYAPFGIWLARNSLAQMDSIKVKKLDSETSLKKRLAYLRDHGKPFMTLVYVGGHIMLYVGEDENNMPVLYQNVWYLWKKDEPSVQIIGQSLFLPADVKASNTFSLLDDRASDYFWLGYLDQPT